MIKKLYDEGDFKRPFNAGQSKDPSRSEFFRDYGRVIHSASFRRLQGKTQVFPVNESDFFRNRLTHSLEVSQIAEGIAQKFNYEDEYFKTQNLDTKLITTAALIHDLGHPPFGHNGERALDDAMLNHGGFEGNAQTLRILSNNEKKVKGKDDKPFGLNLTYRTLAAALKYDNKIPISRRADEKLVKGYYKSESKLVKKIKKNVCQDSNKKDFKTVECYIMDIADDIAYSTFDLEDCFKAGFVTPLDIISSSSDLLSAVAQKVEKTIGESFDQTDVLSVMSEIFSDLFSAIDKSNDATVLAGQYYSSSRKLIKDGFYRTGLSSQLVKEAINSTIVTLDHDNPALSKVSLKRDAKIKVEVLKQFTYLKTIHSSLVKVPEYRGYELVQSLFKALSDEKSFLLLPDDVRSLHQSASGDFSKQMRIVCDFVSGMTDRYAVEFYGRLHSDSAQSMFKPL
ncbi:dGTP triphosphohydrolase [Kozakia baliensis]|uniref:dGTP triphosphohydrolase n=1 Tax=Kozakia baliensis TaxID=153496 RepID=UPI0004986A68|nr:dNTP triphosphohydrolase [Kozakia baliensis]